MGVLLGQPKYRTIYFSDQAPDDQKLLSLLELLNGTRNTLHFLNIEYIASGMVIGDFSFLRDYVTTHIDALANKISDESKGDLEIGRAEIDHLRDIDFDDA
jgi:hypothetical protein